MGRKDGETPRAASPPSVGVVGAGGNKTTRNDDEAGRATPVLLCSETRTAAAVSMTGAEISAGASIRSMAAALLRDGEISTAPTSPTTAAECEVARDGEISAAPTSPTTAAGWDVAKRDSARR